MGQIPNAQQFKRSAIEGNMHCCSYFWCELTMRTLKIVCVFFCLLSLASALTGTRAIDWSSGGLHITKHAGIGVMLWSVFNALLYATAVYGIHRRVPMVWKLGWVVLIISSLHFMIGGVSSVLRQPGGWVGAAGILIAGVLVTVYWGRWWNRQRDYFYRVALREQTQ